jgi:hypothetical protein
MHNRSCETADTYCMDTNDFVFLVEHQHHKVLPIHIGKVRMSQRTCISRAANLFVITMQSAFTDQGYAINGNAGVFRLGGVFFAQKGRLFTDYSLSVFHGQWLHP